MHYLDNWTFQLKRREKPTELLGDIEQLPRTAFEKIKPSAAYSIQPLLFAGKNIECKRLDLIFSLKQMTYEKKEKF